MNPFPPSLRLPLLVLLACAALGACDKSRTAYALTSTNSIIKFETDTPNTIESEAAVSGLDSGDSLIQIDYRPANKAMYGLTAKNFVVSVNPDSGAVSKLASTAFTPPTTLVTPVVMDINPVGDYLRIIDYAGSSTGRTNNFRVAFDGVTVTPDYTAATPALYYNDNDTNSGEVPQLASIAHSNNVSGATASTLYGLDITTQSLVTIATSGQLKTVANCGHSFIAGNAGFDIVPDSDQAFAAIGSASENAVFYKVNLSDCNLDRVDEIGGSRRILSLAVTLDEKDKNN